MKTTAEFLLVDKTKFGFAGDCHARNLEINFRSEKIKVKRRKFYFWKPKIKIFAFLWCPEIGSLKIFDKNCYFDSKKD